MRRESGWHLEYGKLPQRRVLAGAPVGWDGVHGAMVNFPSVFFLMVISPEKNGFKMQNIGISPGKAGSQDNLSYIRTQKVYGLWNFEWKCCHNPTGSGIIAAETQGVLGGSSSQNVLKSSMIELVRQSYSSSESDYPSNLSKPCWIPKNLDCPSTR